MLELLYGKNPVLEALRAKRRRLQTLFCLKGKEENQLTEIISLAQSQKVAIQEVAKGWFLEKFGSKLHQGVALSCGAYPLVDWVRWRDEIQETLKGVVIALDQIQDPQNLGAILRVAEACGVKGILLPKHHRAPLSPAVSKSSAGALEHLKVIQVSNLAQALKQMQQRGFWIVGTQAYQAESALEFEWPEKSVLVLGAEGSGMRPLTQKHCDFLIRLPLSGEVGSLNVATTAAACLYLREKLFA